MSASPSSREKILDVAEALFSRRGYAGVGLREVAEAAGLGKSSLFHHFGGKASLYCEVMGRVLEDIRLRLAPVFRAEEPPGWVIEHVVTGLVDALAERPTAARLLLRGLFEEEEFRRDPPPQFAAVEAILKSILADLRGVLEAGIRSGAFRPVSVPDTMQTLIGATVYHFASADVGEAILGEPLFAAESVARRKRELTGLIRVALRVKEPRPAPGALPTQEQSP